MVALVLFQPDIPQNTGAILRLGACLGVAVHVIGPAGFDLSDRRLKRSGMDYLAHAKLQAHLSFDDFLAWRKSEPGRLILMTTSAHHAYVDFSFRGGDLLLFGRESAGVPEHVHQAADASLLVPMAPAMRSLNLASSAAMVLGEALRQTRGFPA